MSLDGSIATDVIALFGGAASAFRQRSSSAGVVIHGTFRALATTPFFIRHFERAGFVTDVGATT